MSSSASLASASGLASAILSWAGALGGLTTSLLVVAVGRRHRPARAIVSVRQPPRPLQPEQHWRVVTDVVRTGIVDAQTAAATHARAAQQVGAAEYAFDRLLEELALVMPLPLAPPLPSVREPARKAAPVLDQLAA